jgi:hypothetical protein
LPVVSAFVRFLIKFRAGDVKEIYWVVYSFVNICAVKSHFT